jgi:hypothetical protein
MANRGTQDIIALLFAATLCLVILGAVVVSLFVPLPEWVSLSLSQMLSVMVGGIVGYAAAKRD